MENENYLNRFMGRIFRAHTAYLVWKAIKMSLNQLSVGEEKAQHNNITLNTYDGGQIFLAILSALESNFIIEIHKFFDPTKGVLRLFDLNSKSSSVATGSIVEEDKERIKTIIEENKDTLERIKHLRDNLFGHDSKNSEQVFRIPSIDDLEKVFVGIKEIHNLVSKNTTKAFYAWSDQEWNEVYGGFEMMLGDLELGRNKRIFDTEEEWNKKYGIVKNEHAT